MILRYTASLSDNGRKVYTIMRRELQVSAALTRRLKQCDAIRVDGRPVYTDRLLAPGETLELDIAAAEPASDIVPEDGPVDILYEDDGLLAVNKPSGVITHPSRARYTGSLSNFVAGYLEKTSGDGHCHAVNRLDRDTSGVVLFAKNSYMKALASDALSGPDAHKEYTALVSGVFEPPSGLIDLPIRRLQEMDMRRIVAPDGQRAVTHYVTVGAGCISGHNVSVLSLTLETGRTHQIRVHCHHLGHPVLGDGLYYTEESQETSMALGIGAQALHARRLTFIHPITNKPIVIEAPEPGMFSLIKSSITLLSTSKNSQSTNY
jgi:23S rRNA pseudouridine1911/1915/1917 synthase